MFLIELISDADLQDAYLGVFKTKVYTQISDAVIIDLSVGSSQSVQYKKSLYIERAAIAILSVQNDAPANTVYISDINDVGYYESAKALLIQYNNQWIITYDNGLVGLLDVKKIQAIYVYKQKIENPFPLKKEFFDILSLLYINKFSVTDSFTPISLEKCKSIYRHPLNIQEKANGEKNITLPVVYTDEYGNIWFNLQKAEFENLIQNHSFEFIIPNKIIKQINKHYNEVTIGEPVLIFNDIGFLELALNGENCRTLLIPHQVGASWDNFTILLKIKNTI